MKQFNIIFLVSHPIQYFAPMYRAIYEREPFSGCVWYCSGHGLKGEWDQEFGTEVKWDIPVLQGYPYRFLKNHARRPSIYRFGGLINLGLIKALYRAPRSILVVHGWNYISHLLVVFFGRLFGHRVCLRAESPLSHEQNKKGIKKIIRRFFLKGFLFPLVHYFLYIGKQNKAFYLHFGVKEARLIFTPYAVDNDRFHEASHRLKNEGENLRKELGLPLDKKIILFSGKYIPKKRPMDLLQAFAKTGNCDAALVFMGEGTLRTEMEQFIKANELKDVYLTGFINQSEVVKYYALADLFVMCSEYGETWGLSTNEAMNFSLPLLLSDLTGSANDLVVPNANGEVFKTGSVDELAQKLHQMLTLPDRQLKNMGRFSRQHIQKYSYEQIINGIKTVAGI